MTQQGTLFSRADCEPPPEHAIRGRLVLIADPGRVEEAFIPFAWPAPDGQGVVVLKWCPSPKLHLAGQVFACFWDGAHTWTAATMDDVPPLPAGTAGFATMEDAQRAIDAAGQQ